MKAIRSEAILITVLVSLTCLGQTKYITPSEPPHLKRDRTQNILYPKIVELEDKRLASDELLDMLSQPHLGVRHRAIIALGRIGYPVAVSPLVEIMKSSRDEESRELSAFALGQIGSQYAAEPLLGIIETASEPAALRAQAAEALGLIFSNKESAEALGAFGRKAMAELVARSLPQPSEPITPDTKLVGSGVLTALLWMKQPETMGAIAAELKSPDSDLRWQAANVMTRIGGPFGDSVSVLIGLLGDQNPFVRTNAARALGAAKNPEAVVPLEKLLNDPDPRVEEEAINALGRIGDHRAVPVLLESGSKELDSYKIYDRNLGGVPPQLNRLTCLATALGNLGDASALPFLRKLRFVDGKIGPNPEVEMALAKFGEAAFFDIPGGVKIEPNDWQAMSAFAQGLGHLEGDRAWTTLQEILDGDLSGKPDARAVPDILQSLVAVKRSSPEARELLVNQLKQPDPFVRATAADLLGELGDNTERVIQALKEALKASKSDNVNDARVSIIQAANALGHPFNLEVLAGDLEDDDYIVRRTAAHLARQSGITANISKLDIGGVKSTRGREYWKRITVLMTEPGNPEAIIRTKKGDIRIELFAADAPMAVANFEDLAAKGFYKGLTFMRVVPDFVIQGGDPRNDTNGGPGYQIRDEINQRRFLAGSLGMALSGKDTGGSQFFITQSPQPHLDGKYTVFGQVTSGMDVVTRIARGDVIESVEIVLRKQ